MKSIFFKVFLISFVGLFLLSSCTNIIQEPGEINLNIPVLRTAEENKQLAFTISLYNSNGNLFDKVENVTDNVSMKNIPGGEYLVTATAEDEFFTYSAESKVTIIPGEIVDVLLKLNVTEKNIAPNPGNGGTPEVFNTPVARLPENGKGIEILLPKTEYTGMNVIAVVRKNVKTGEEIDAVATSDLTKKSLLDMFVEPGAEYQYSVAYIKDAMLIGQTELSNPIVATSGYDKIDLSVLPKATYDESTNIMTFESIPNYDNQLGQYTGNNKSYVTIIEYTTPDLRGNFMSELKQGEKTIDWSKAIRPEWESEYYGKPLVVKDIGVMITIDGTFYPLSFEGQELDNIKTKFPNIKIADLRPELVCTSTPTTNGVEVQLIHKDFADKVPSDAKIYIGRTCKEYPDYFSGNMPYWYIQATDMTKTAITDYFVRPGLTYYYTLYYRNKDNSDIIYLETKPFEIKAASGVGPGISESTSVTFDESTQKTTINPMPSFTNFPDATFYYQLWYRNENTGNVAFGSVEKNGENGIIDWVNTNNISESCIGKPIVLECFRTRTEINNISYSNYIYEDEISAMIPTIDKTLVLGQQRESLNLASGTEGIVITMPEKPAEAEECNIVRTNLGTKAVEEINITDLKNNNITGFTDYFVETNNSYMYEFTYTKANQYNQQTVIKSLKQTKITATEGGKGELKYITAPSATYEPTTNIMTFTQLPVLPDTINNLQNININESLVYFSSNQNRGRIFIHIPKPPKDGVSGNFNQSVNFSNYTDCFNQELLLNYGLIEVVDQGKDKDKNIRFSSKVPVSELSSLPSPITVKDLREKITLESNADTNGVKVIFPKDLSTATRCNVYRRVVGDRNWDSCMYLNSGDFIGTNAQYVVDPFVDTTKQYEYYIDWNENVNGTENCFKTQITDPITPTSGLGELKSPVAPVASYSSETGIMTFTTLPRFSDQVTNFQPDENSRKIRITYWGKPNRGWVIYADVKQTVDCAAALAPDPDPDCYGMELTLSGIQYEVRKNNVYYCNVSTEGTLPNPIVVPNLNGVGQQQIK